jgi:hypothetical protein
VRTLLTATLFVCATLYAASASAWGASGGLLVGNGFEDSYQLGIGARGGFTLPFSLYVGGTFVYHLGTTETIGGQEFKQNMFYFGPEGGYDVTAGPLTLRPYLGLGYANFMTSRSGECDDTVGGCTTGSRSEGKLAFWPGATALVGLAGVFAGIDARYIAVLDERADNAFVLSGTAGLSF